MSESRSGQVRRELAPLEPGVVTVGAIHGGTKHSLISSEVRLEPHGTD